MPMILSLEKEFLSTLYILRNIKNRKVKESHIVKNGTPNYYSLLLQLKFRDNMDYMTEMVNKYEKEW